MIRSILAILAGIITLSITSFALEAVANSLMRWMFPDAFPNQAAIDQNLPARLFMFAYTTLCVAAGGYVTARVTRRSEVRHAVIMALVQVALTVMAMIQLYDKAPLWFWITGMALVTPAAWCGGIMRAKQVKAGGLRPVP
jgi:hypothetical protein